MEAAGKINEYVCEKCGKATRTINADEGVTPFLIKCRPAIPGTCDGMAKSRMYQCSQVERPQFEWYRPTDAQLDDMATREPEAAKAWHQHAANGGLMLRRVRHETLEAFGLGLRAG